MTSFLFQTNCNHSQTHLGITITPASHAAKMINKASMQLWKTASVWDALPKPTTEHPGPDRNASKGHTQNCWRYRWQTGKTQINCSSAPSSAESLLFKRSCYIGPLLPSLTDTSILGWSSCRVAAKHASQQDRYQHLESEFQAPTSL